MKPEIAVYFDHLRWMEPLFAALARRGLPFSKLEAEQHRFGLDEAPPAPLVFNRLSMGSVMRHSEHAVFYTAALLDHWERGGARVVNGSRPFGFDQSKARQLSLFRILGLDTPATRVIHRIEDAPAAAEGLRFPVLVKVNIGGSGKGIDRFDTPQSLADAARERRLTLGADGVALVQEAAPRRANKVTRLETLGGRFLYAIDLTVELETFDLCPADVCRLDAPGAVTITAARPSREAIAAAERIAQASGLDVGGVEMLVDDRDGRALFFDFNGFSNFVADAPNVIGFDPHERLVDFLVDQIDARREAA